MIRTNSEYQKKLLKRWAPILEKGEAIGSLEQKITLAQVLENTRKEFTKRGLFTEEAHVPTQVGTTLDKRPQAYNAPVAGQGMMTKDDYILPNMVMPMLRRIFPTLMAHELVGVQAMTGPTGVVMALRAVAANNTHKGGTGKAGYEFGYGENGRFGQAQFTGSGDAWGDPIPAAADSAIQNGLVRGFKSNKDAFASFLGKHTPGRGVATQEGEGYHPADNPGFGNWGTNTYPQATIRFEKRVVAAETRKLGSEWTPEDAEDLEAQQGIDFESEMMNLISYQLGAEIDQQIKESMLFSAWDNAKDCDVSALDGLDQMGRIAAMLTLVTKEANEIAVKTRRGAGNFVLASTTICSCLQQLGTSKLVTDGKTLPSVPASSIGAMTKEGLINDGRQLLVRDTNTLSSYALVGYKGTTAGDNGIIYCPYIPVTLYKAIRPDTGISVIGARTRYGLVDNPFDAANFYSLIKFTGFNTKYSLTAADRYFFGGLVEGNEKGEKTDGQTGYQFRSGIVG